MNKYLALLLLFLLKMSAGFSQYNGIITGKLPQLAYSNGEDRLGSAKMGYIDTGIVLKIIDSANELYQVRLSKNHSAYLDKKMMVTRLDTAIQKPALTESWSTRGEDGFDYLTISLSKKIAYKSWLETGPARIVIEIYGVMSNTNWITQLQNVKEIKSIAFEQTEDDVVRVAISLKHQQPWGYAIGYRGKSLQLKIKQFPPKPTIKNMVIAIDAGHGGTNLGADGVTPGVQEKNYTLLFAKELQDILTRKHATVIMTRENDTTFDNKDRVLFLRQIWPDLFISFHLNSSSRPTARGVSTYYKHVAYRPFTQAILKRLLSIDSLKEFGNVGNFNFQPIQPTEFNSSLVEVAFLSSPDDEKLILDDKFRKQVATQVYKGMKDFLKNLK
ncbi:MAG: N-acetylmuramoyl-L-alanine amidase [Chitinophagaceae bacterium]